MLQPAFHAIKGTSALLVVVVNTISITSAIIILAVLKLISPPGAVKNTINHWLSALGELWVSINKLLVWFYRDMEWDIHLPDGLNRKGRYLVFSNHNSWVDIIVLQHSLNRRAPFMRFLLKQELIWVPFLGLAWWALDMAFLRRYSAQELLKDPSLRGKDLENAARACEKLKQIPVSMMTFPEGTRFTRSKRDQQNSPYKHLLRPRYGGIGQVLYSFDGALENLIDVTILYPDGTPTLWQFASGQVRKISVFVRIRPIDADLHGKDFRTDADARSRLKDWLNELWVNKDRVITQAFEAKRHTD